MKVNGEILKTLEVFPTMMTVPDCIVDLANKIGRGHGEAKFYVSSKDKMRSFYGGKGFVAKCFILKKDILSYMKAIKNEYLKPSQEYAQKDKFPVLWNERIKMIESLDDIIFFDIKDQVQLVGNRGYINSTDKGYQIIREVALPLISYIYVEKVGDPKSPMFYWKLFADFETIWEKKNGPLVFYYGKSKEKLNNVDKLKLKTQNISKNIICARDGQGKYREELLKQCHYCPFTMIADERLLIASHIKPWVASNNKEKVDPFNGYILSPLYDKLFDKGFITFTKDRHIILSEFISSFTWKQIKLENDKFIKTLPMDDKRIKYLDFHHDNVFKGAFDN